ncbi:hypothetical protein D3C87_1748670 [compost metagenome]
MIEVLVNFLNSSADRCGVPPLPADAYEYLSGLARSSLRNSSRFRAGKFLLTISTVGATAMAATGAKSSTLLNCRSGYRTALIV